MKKHLLAVMLGCAALSASADNILIETESFSNPGGWQVDQQFMDQMGSPYLIAHGTGTPVNSATTSVNVPSAGTYNIWVRTYNWTSPWHKDIKGPGKFTLKVNGKTIAKELGSKGNSWEWQYAGKTKIKGTAKLTLTDETGFDGRCDAIYMTTDTKDVPPSDLTELKKWRESKSAFKEIKNAGDYDLVVIGGGIAGMSAAVSAARLGSKVALINDRPVLGGNNSSEIRVHLGGYLDVGKYPELGGMQKEFGPLKKGNAQPADYYEDSKKQEWLDKEKNVKLFPNCHVNEVKVDNGIIKSVIAQNISTGERLEFSSPLFADCTGDGTVGYLAGADFRMGRECHDEFGESMAPVTADSLSMGTSVQWRSVEEKGKKLKFPVFNYGPKFSPESCQRVKMGEWTWETGMDKNQIEDFEKIRDYGLLVVYGNWSYLKNELGIFPDRKLDWVAYIGGKRESRRLLGDYILKEDDIKKMVNHEDASFTTSWTIDLHFKDSLNSEQFPGGEFLAATNHVKIYPYSVPYRCLYSRNINNLFMAGRDISVTHVALGTVRVMRTAGAMGEVVGMAADICRRNNTLPRQVYQNHLPELKSLMTKGVNYKGLPNNQKYNQGKRLKVPPKWVNGK